MNYTSDQGSIRHIPLQSSLQHSCLVTAFSASSHRSLFESFPNLQNTSRFCNAVCQAKHLESEQEDQSVDIQRGHSMFPHFSTVSGMSRPASSHKLLSTFCVEFSNLTIQWAVLNCREGKCISLSDLARNKSELTLYPLPLLPHVCEHSDQGVIIHSKCSFSCRCGLARATASSAGCISSSSKQPSILSMILAVCSSFPLTE